MHLKTRRWPLLFGLLLILSATPSTTIAQSDGDAGRIVAVGDIHGAYDALVRVLQQAELIDDDLAWSGGSTTLVQTGDFLDRGPGVRSAMDLLMRLQDEAAAAGGQVIVLLGNHEVLNLVSEPRDSTPEIWATFASADEETRKKTLHEAFKEYTTVYFESDAAWRRATRPQRDDIREKWIADQPAGRIEYMQALGPDGQYGAWLRSLPATAVVNDILFMHAGLSPQLAAWSLDDINERIREEIALWDGYRAYLLDRKRITSFGDLQEVIRGAAAETGGLEWFEPTPIQLNKPPALHSPDLKGLDKEERFTPLLQINGWWLLAEQGPMWYRGFATAPDGALEAMLPGQLEALGVRAVVVAHSPAVGKVRTRADGRVYLIDTGMLASAYQGKGSALIIEGDVVEAVYEDGSREPLAPLAPKMEVSANR